MTVLNLLQGNKIPSQLAYDHGHKDVVSYLAKKTVDIDPSKVLFSKSYSVVGNISSFIVSAAEDTTRYFSFSPSQRTQETTCPYQHTRNYYWYG